MLRFQFSNTFNNSGRHSSKNNHSLFTLILYCDYSFLWHNMRKHFRSYVTPLIHRICGDAAQQTVLAFKFEVRFT